MMARGLNKHICYLRSHIKLNQRCVVYSGPVVKSAIVDKIKLGFDPKELAKEERKLYAKKLRDARKESQATMLKPAEAPAVIIEQKKKRVQQPLCTHVFVERLYAPISRKRND